MSVPRWTFNPYGYVVMRDGKRAFSLVPVESYEHRSARISSAEMDALADRIVALLNAIELAPDAIATLQTAVAGVAAFTAIPGLDGEQRAHELVLNTTLNNLSTVLDRAARVFVELREETITKEVQK